MFLCRVPEVSKEFHELPTPSNEKPDSPLALSTASPFAGSQSLHPRHPWSWKARVKQLSLGYLHGGHPSVSPHPQALCASFSLIIGGVLRSPPESLCPVVRDLSKVQCDHTRLSNSGKTVKYKLLTLPQVTLVLRNLPSNAGDVRDAGSTLGQEDALQEGTATHSRIPAQRIPWTEEPGGWATQRVGRD